MACKDDLGKKRGRGSKVEVEEGSEMGANCLRCISSCWLDGRVDFVVGCS